LQALPEFMQPILPTFMQHSSTKAPNQCFESAIRLLEFFSSNNDMLPLRDITGSNKVSWRQLMSALQYDDEVYTQLCDVLLRVKAECADTEDGDEGVFTIF
jgi:hypothetical protein